MTKVIGNTVGVPNPKSDLAQTDPTKADYVKNKKMSFIENDIGYITEKDIPDEYITESKIEELTNDILNKAKQSGEFDGQDGYTPKKGIDYFDGKDGNDGVDGLTPHIGENGNWWVGTTDTKVKAEGTDGVDGKDGKDGQDGYTPQKGVDYYTEADKEELVADVTSKIDITIDTKMSDTSENAVQNKVIKHYVDDTTGNKNDLYTRDKYTLVDAINEVYIANDNKADKTLANVDDATFKQKAEQAGIGGENIPTKLSDLEDDSFDKPINASIYSSYATGDEFERRFIDTYAEKPYIVNVKDTTYIYDFVQSPNNDIRCNSVDSISIIFKDGAYLSDYISGLSFNSGETPTSIDYVDAHILNWIGTDCTNDNGLSIFQPSANTHYDIVFYFNGAQFIGLVNGFVPAKGNVVSE